MTLYLFLSTLSIYLEHGADGYCIRRLCLITKNFYSSKCPIEKIKLSYFCGKILARMIYSTSFFYLSLCSEWASWTTVASIFKVTAPKAAPSDVLTNAIGISYRWFPSRQSPLAKLERVFLSKCLPDYAADSELWDFFVQNMQFTKKSNESSVKGSYGYMI